MHRKHINSKRLITRIFVYFIMAASVVALVTAITMFMLGFRIANGTLEQYGLIQFSSTPSGATVSIDGKVINSRTPNKQTVPPGKHEVVMWRDGYETWRKTIDVKVGTIIWLNYALMVPQNLETESVIKYESISYSLASPRGRRMIISQNKSQPVFDLVTLDSDKPKTEKIEITSDIYSEADSQSVTHNFKLIKWDSSERYVLIKHTFNNGNEWIVLDTENAESTHNITKTFDIDITNVTFAGSGGNDYYVLDSGDLRKLDVSAGTISKPLIKKVISFDYYDESRVITYVGNGKDGAKERVAGSYREGDDSAAVIRTIKGSGPLYIKTSRYFNENYVAIAHNKTVEILNGSYPNTTSDNANAMKVLSTVNVDKPVNEINFSPKGEYVFIRTDNGYTSYDLEYRNLAKISFSNKSSSLRWLNDNYLWSDMNGELTIMEFDGTNVHKLSEVVSGHQVVVTNNGRYIYSIGMSNSGFQLQRVRMILP